MPETFLSWCSGGKLMLSSVSTCQTEVPTVSRVTVERWLLLGYFMIFSLWVLSRNTLKRGLSLEEFVNIGQVYN